MSDQARNLSVENAHLRDQIESLRLQNERLHREVQELQTALDAHVSRARSTSLFGPVEMTAGTSVGPRRGH